VTGSVRGVMAVPLRKMRLGGGLDQRSRNLQNESNGWIMVKGAQHASALLCADRVKNEAPSASLSWTARSLETETRLGLIHCP
jgi:hypothetical protein